MEKTTPYIEFEHESTKDKLGWKADVIAYTHKAYATYEEDYHKVANCIFELLCRDYGYCKWYVFAYYEGTCVPWLQGDCCCIVAYNLKTKHREVLCKACICAYDNTSFIASAGVVTPLLGGHKRVAILKQGGVDPQALLYYYGRCLMEEAAVDINKVSELLVHDGKKMGLGTYWAICECVKGGFAGNCCEGHYVVFQFWNKIFLNVRLA